MGELYEALREALRAEEPIALVSIVEGPRVGAQLLVRPGAEALGTLGDADVDRVVVCDALAVFATPPRSPDADEVVVDWPARYLAKAGDDLGPRDVVCVLTHDPEFDVPAIVAALETEVGYLGAMGSRRTHADRVQRLREAGVSDEGLARVMAPIGLDIGARTPEETAISICSEIIALRTGR